MRKLETRDKSHEIRVTPALLGKNCVQPVSEAMNNEWVHYPQGIQNLWMSSIHPMIVSSFSRLFRSRLHFISTKLYAPKIHDITDKQSYLSTLSTPPIITTTIYI